MKFVKDPRIKVALRSFVISWVFFAIYVFVVLVLSYVLGTKPYILGLPRWVAIGNLLVPTLFVLLLIFIVERFIPSVPLTDDEKEGEEEE